jgi:predicted  nucleic acid-binding Zn-ribbon protein
MLYSTAAFALRKSCKTRVEMKKLNVEIDFLQKSLASKNAQVADLEDRIGKISF